MTRDICSEAHATRLHGSNLESLGLEATELILVVFFLHRDLWRLLHEHLVLSVALEAILVGVFNSV